MVATGPRAGTGSGVQAGSSTPQTRAVSLASGGPQARRARSSSSPAPPPAGTAYRRGIPPSTTRTPLDLLLLVADQIAGLYVAAVAMVAAMTLMISGAWLLLVGVTMRESKPFDRSP